MIKANAANLTGASSLSLTVGRGQKHRLTLAPPVRRKAPAAGIGIAPYRSRDMMHLDILYYGSVSHPDADTAGAVLHHAVRHDDIPNISMCLRSDLKRGIMRRQNTASNQNILTGAILLRDRLGRLDHYGIVSCRDKTVRDHYILTGVRIDSIIISAAHIIEDLNSLYSYPPAACHMQRPQCGIPKGHVLHRKILHIFKIRQPRTKSLRHQRTFMVFSIRTVIIHHLAALSVDLTQSCKSHILSMDRAHKISGILHTAIRMRRQMDIFFVKTGNQ